MNNQVPLDGKSTHALRGDYTAMRADWTVDQDMAGYSATDRAVWAALFHRQMKLIETHAAPEFIAGAKLLMDGDQIPSLEAASQRLAARTGFRLVAVPGLIPDDVFFAHLAARRFPVTTWVRKPEELDYLVEPDLFHDFFGHVPLLSNPVFADFLARYGESGLKAAGRGDTSHLARLYWYMVEFGLIATPDGLRAYGAGMLSSRDETAYCLESPRPHRVGFDVRRVMATAYMIDDFQKTYFVLDSYDQLFEACAGDLLAIADAIGAGPGLDPARLHPGDLVIHAGTIADEAAAA